MALSLSCCAGMAEDFYTPEDDVRNLERQHNAATTLPNVLIIGDSISIGYTPEAAALLKDISNVQRPKVNCGDTRSGLKNLKNWLGDTRWEVIHFNWGLHDLCYRHPESKVYGHRDKVNGTISVPVAQYEENLEILVRQLRENGAKLIWATTTVVPEGEAGRFAGDELTYNQAAAKIMKRHGIIINDLHAVTANFPPELFVAPGDVHFRPAGYEKLAAQVAGVIRTVLETGSKTEPVR